jgi:CHASE2 domain-containing sensor protein
MAYLIVLNLGNGDWQRGLPTVIAQLWDSHSQTPMQFTGSLPPNAALDDQYQHWRSLYTALYAHLGWRRTPQIEFEIDETDLTHVSQSEFAHLSQTMQIALNEWLNSESFRKIDRQLRTQLSTHDEIRLIIVAEDAKLLQLPWCLWSFLDDYPNAEIAVSLPEYTRSPKVSKAKNNETVNVLAVLGNSSGINVAQDLALLQQLPKAEIKFLVEPSSQSLTQQLWEPGWDVLFFAGHSSSQGKGHIQLNQTEQLTIEQLKYGLKTAIAHGLKLAIFNSCDGLGLAQDLADLHLPQVIVMREPIPDRVAQTFLKHFLAAFASGKSLYASVREARERLQALETEFPCASWLPVLCQNPAETPPTWVDLSAAHPSTGSTRRLGASLATAPRSTWKALLIGSLAVTGLVAGVRWLGWLQPVELWAIDRLLQSRPAEVPDDRLLIVTITDADIQAEGQAMRHGSISDRTLNRLIERLEQADPHSIGLDIYRDTPATDPGLAKRLKESDRLFSICKRAGEGVDATEILPPPGVPETQVSANNVVIDSDGVIRRHLLFLSPDATSHCTAAYTLSTVLAQHYLSAKGLSTQFTANQELQIGTTVFPNLSSRTGGYQSFDHRGGQVLLNYRASPTPQAIASQVTVAQVLAGQVNPNAIKNRIVLIGVAAPLSGGDYWTTPYSSAHTETLPGVLVHAQMVSQMLSAVLDRRPLLWVWSPIVEVIWIGSWAALGGLLGWSLRRSLLWFWLAEGIVIVGLVGCCWLILLVGGWVPLVPAALGLLMTGATVFVYRSSTQDSPL